MPTRYANRVLAYLNQYLLNRIEPVLVPGSSKFLPHPPIFFLGAPRSGSTLAVQVVTDALDLGYISNRHCQWFGAPALAERVFRPTANRPASDYSSAHGATKGFHAPAECGAWWYRFFPRQPAYVTLEQVDPRKMLEFRRSVAALTIAFERPVVFKNLYASLRIQPIAHYLPESLFVVMHRNEIDNGHSLLEGRYKVFGNYDQWWSMEPAQVESLKTLPAHQQVIEQIRHIHTTIDNDFKVAGVPSSRRFDLSYEAFCEDPAIVIDDLLGFLALHGCNVSRRGAVPPVFKRRDEVRIDPFVYEAMVKYAQTV
jgi:hypothetical protein